MASCKTVMGGFVGDCIRQFACDGIVYLRIKWGREFLHFLV